jgi:hypothetical protein
VSKQLWTTEQWAEFFEYLDALRASGVTNMYGAGQYIETAFGVSRRSAVKILVAWMKSFDRDVSPAMRASNMSARS